MGLLQIKSARDAMSTCNHKCRLLEKTNAELEQRVSDLNLRLLAVRFPLAQRLPSGECGRQDAWRLAEGLSWTCAQAESDINAEAHKDAARLKKAIAELQSELSQCQNLLVQESTFVRDLFEVTIS